MENVEVKKEEVKKVEQPKKVDAGQAYSNQLLKKNSKEQKKVLKAFMEKRNEARAAQKMKPAYSKEEIAAATK